MPSALEIEFFIFFARELAFVANRKNTDEHVVLLAWSGDDVERPTCLEFEQEKFIPRIDLQGIDITSFLRFDVV